RIPSSACNPIPCSFPANPARSVVYGAHPPKINLATLPPPWRRHGTRRSTRQFLQSCSRAFRSKPHRGRIGASDPRPSDDDGGGGSRGLCPPEEGDDTQYKVRSTRSERQRSNARAHRPPSEATPSASEQGVEAPAGSARGRRGTTRSTGSAQRGAS